MEIHKYRPLNTDMLAMINKEISYDEEFALKIIKSSECVDEIFEYEIDGLSFTLKSTYMGLAVDANNLPIVKLLLENGANPNYVDEENADCPLWNLQYLEDGQDPNERYEIEKLFFKYGANPNLVPEKDDEGLYDYVLWKIYNDRPTRDDDWKNLKQFYKLLILYGGGEGCHYGKPELHDVDMSEIDNYDIALYRSNDGYHIEGYLEDSNGRELGRL